MDDARKDLDEARAFVQAEASAHAARARQPASDSHARVHARQSTPVGGFNPAPALEPQLGRLLLGHADSRRPGRRTRVDSKLREYNFYKLKLLTIHEAMPGHYVQLEIANDVAAASRAACCASVFGNGPYIEGWGQYSTQMMLDEGFLNHSPELALTFAKEELRVIANAILDVRLQMLEHDRPGSARPDGEADLPGAEEAAAKLQRAKLSSCPVAHVFRGLARLAAGARRIPARPRAAPSACPISTTAR